MDTKLNGRRVDQLEKALQATSPDEVAEALGKLRLLGFATRSDEIPKAAHPSWSIRDFFGHRKDDLVPLALLPRELWPAYRSPGTLGNAVWLCACEACGRLTTRISGELRPASRTTSCGCRGRARTDRAA